MKKILSLITAAFMVAMSMNVHAQPWPVGIASVQDSVKSIQFGFISSAAIRQMKGVQIGGFVNISAAPIQGLQFSAFNNTSLGVKRGLQLTTLANIASGKVSGAQLSIYNFTDTLNGAQVGLINTAISHPKGWQVGLLNISHDTIGHKIGLVNVDPNTTIDFMAFGGNANKINLAARFRNRSTYRIGGFGTHYMGLDEKFSGALFYRLGQFIPLSRRWSLSGDLGFAHIETFEHNSANKPERLFSLEARVNVDYQFHKKWGAFATIGYGDTRYYKGGGRFRNRMLVEAGLTLRHQQRMGAAPINRKEKYFEYSDSLSLWPKHKYPWIAVAEATGINVFVHCFDRWALKSDFAQTTWKSIGHNFETGFVWDNDFFITNLFAHPYHGNLYYNSARSNGLNFWQSAPFALGGSLMWELFGETEPPAINDIFASTVGGIAIGEVTHRLSDAVLNDGQTGFRRFLREAGALLIDPIKGLNRICSGEAWRVHRDRPLHHDWKRFPLDFTITLGDRYLADNRALFRGEHNPYLTFGLEYGDVMNEDANNKPYDYFSAEISAGFSSNQPLINRLHLLGRLWSTPMYSHKGLRAEFGVYQHYNYYDSKPVKDGSDLMPYRISEAAAAGPGFVVQMPQMGILDKLEQRVFFSGILLGGTKSDLFNVIERDYNMGSGYSVKARNYIELRNFGRLVSNVSFFKIYTWKGYENKDLTGYANGTEDLHYLNVQGDRGNAALLVINPAIEVDLGKNWGFNLNGSYFYRRTNYKYRYDADTKVFIKDWHNVVAKTFEIRAGISYHL